MREKNIKTVLGSLLNMNIGLYLNDTQFVEGVLRSVLQDHIAVDVNGKVCFFSIEHIQALSKNTKDYRVFPQNDHDLRNNFVDTLKALKYNWVTINGLSNQAHFGVLSSILDDYIILINNEELLYVAKSSISNIYQGLSNQEITFISNSEDQNIANKTSEEISEVDEQYEKIGKEKATQYSVSRVNEEERQADKERVVVLEHIETTNNSELEESVKTTNMVEQMQETTEQVIDQILSNIETNDSFEEEERHADQEQVVLEHIETTNNSELEESVKTTNTVEQMQETTDAVMEILTVPLPAENMEEINKFQEIDQVLSNIETKDSFEEEERQVDQEQVVLEHIETTNNSELEESVETTNTVEQMQGTTDAVMEIPTVPLPTENMEETNKLQVIDQVLSNIETNDSFEEEEQYEEISKEKATQNSVSGVIEEEKYADQEQVVLEHIETTNNIELDKNVETTSMVEQKEKTEVVMEIPDVPLPTENMEEPIKLQVIAQVLSNIETNDLFEEEERQADQEQVVLEHIETTNNSELEESVETTNTVEQMQETKDAVMEISSVPLPIESMEEPIKLQVIDQVLSNIETSDSFEEEERQVDQEHVVLEHIETTNNSELDKNVETTSMVEKKKEKTDVIMEIPDVSLPTSSMKKPIKLHVTVHVSRVNEEERHAEQEQVVLEHIETTNNNELEESVETTTMVEQRKETTVTVMEIPTVPLPTENMEEPLQIIDQVLSNLKTNDSFEEEEQFTLVKPESKENVSLIPEENSIIIEHLLERLKSIVQLMDGDKSVNNLVDIEDNQLDQQDFLDTYKDNKNLLIGDAKIHHKEAPVRENEKRVLLTPWSKMNFDQNTITISPKNIKESEFSPNFNSPFASKLSLKVSKSAIDEKHDFPIVAEVLNDEQSSMLPETSETKELIAPQTPAVLLSPIERKAMIEQQYFSLMRHAEQNSLNNNYIDDSNKDQESEESKKLQMIGQKKGEKVMLEKQFYSLMRHAAKMYRQLRDY